MNKKLLFCRNCNNKKLDKLFTLGKLCFTGKFAKTVNINIPKAEITLVKCNSCHLVQLNRTFNSKYLYGSDYGYRSGINKTMTDHLRKTAKLLSKMTNLRKGDYVLDIASNDATLLHGYKKNIIKTGMDPLVRKFKNFYKDIDYPINNFFSIKCIKKNKIKNKFKVITALSVFYDLEDPNNFLRDIKKIIDNKKGIFLLEFADLLSIIKHKLFDTICHEHLGYYSARVIMDMVKKNGLKVFNINSNDINGGSVRFFISDVNSEYKVNNQNIAKYLKNEDKFKLQKKKTYISFFKKINKLKTSMQKTIKIINTKGKTIHGYGASTKGNVLLQYFKISNSDIPYIADRNIQKDGFYTPGSKIKIISESKSRSLKPDYYLVLPWHFKKEIILREKKIIKSGTKFIFPLPRYTVTN